LRRLIIRPGGIGDSILALPAMEHLRSGYTEIWVRSEILPLINFVDRVRPIAATGLDLFGIEGVEPRAKLIEELGSFCKIDSWYGASRPDFRDAVAKLGLPFRFHDALPPPDAKIHAADFFALQAGAPVPAIPTIPVKAEPHGAVVIHPFSGSPIKNWPYERFTELAGRLGGEWATRYDWVRFAKLDELARWLAGARVFVGNDSCITHLAAAVGTPVVALFGPTDPAIWAPRGDRVRIVRGRSMEDIGIDEIMHAVRSLAG
jgi:heptosyltransferase III